MFNCDVEAYMTLEHKLWGVRVLDGKFSIGQWQLVINFAGIDNPDADPETHQIQLAATYQKLNYWLEYFLDSALFVNAAKEELTGPLCELALENSTLLLPGDPTDDLIIRVLHSKISVLAGEFLLIGKISLKCTDTASTFNYTNNASGYKLPCANYVGDSPVHLLPWWERDDIDTYDYNFDDLDEGTLEEARKDLNTGYILQEIVNDIYRTLSPDEDVRPGSIAEIISIDDTNKWTPKEV